MNRPNSSSNQCYRLPVAVGVVIIAAMTEMTRILDAIAQGDAQAAEHLLPLVYEELRRLAKRKLAHEKPGQTLQATALVHEAYLRLVGSTGRASGESQKRWNSRGHFFAAAAEAIRRILVEIARRKRRIRHGGALRRAELADQPAPTADERLLALDDALKKLGEEDPVAARVVEFRHFAGLGHEQIASVLGITIYQARQKSAYARAWLRDALGD
jgi:RNA polymerase sigma factor (TIGR02999 family)